jgi:hypothetical protein
MKFYVYEKYFGCLYKEFFIISVNSSPNSPFSNGYSMMSPYLSPNTSSYLDASSDGVCGSIVGLNGGIGPPGSHHSNHPPPPHMVSNTYLKTKKKCNYFQNAILFFLLILPLL